jgi:hypothetical protein
MLRGLKSEVEVEAKGDKSEAKAVAANFEAEATD